MANREEFIEEFKKINELNEDTRKSISSLTSSISEMYANLPNVKITKGCFDGIYNSINVYTDALKQIKPITESINISLYTESMSKLFSSISDIQTSFSNNIRNALIHSNFNELYSSIEDTIKSNYINIEDIVVLKKTNLISEIGKDLYVPKGLKTSIKELNTFSSEMLVDNKFIKYSTADNGFVDTDSNNNTSFSSKEMNVVCSTKAMLEHFDGAELFSEEELMDFNNYLDEKPTLAIKHAVGKRIYELIEKKIERIPFDKDIYYHGRVRENGSCPYTKSQMGTAPTGSINPGRYNHTGQSYYYFSDTVDGCIKELGKHNDLDIIQIATLRPNRQISMIDLSGTVKGGKTLLRHIRFPKGNEPVPKAYLIPCFISDCCREMGIDGIKFRGSIDYNNYVCWENKYFEITEMMNKKS